MWRYVVRRLLWVGVVLLVITAVTYAIFFIMAPVDPAILFGGKQPTPAVIQQIQREFGLDKPVWVQYGLFVKHIFLGDQYGWPGLGFSFVTRAPVRSQLGSRLVITTTLAVGASFVWLLLGIPVGVISAVKQRSFVDRLAMGLALFFVSAPVFWIGLMFLWVFWFKLGVAAGTGYYGPAQFGFFTWLNHMIMPWVVLALVEAAWYARMARASLIDTMGEDFIRTARAKGLSERRVIFKHALRASLVPMVTMFGMDLGLLFGGAIITETVFNLQGIGQWAVASVFTGDLPVILAVTLIASFAITLANVVVDICYAYLDPRVRLA
ncbi:MAG: ABC transporter permease [Actinobacteria bacterium]|nr:ABC transporter permease [Actinomycetota bacterium]